MSHLEQTLARQLADLGVAPAVAEYRWAAELLGAGKGLRERLARAGLRDWRFDLAWPAIQFAAEVEGGGWVGGRHTRGAGFAADLAKYHAAMEHGWTVYRCDGGLVKSGQAAALIRRMVAAGNGSIYPIRRSQQ